MTSLMEPRAATVWGLKKHPIAVGKTFLLANYHPWQFMSSQFPTRCPKVTLLWLTRFLLNPSLPLQLIAIQMGAKTEPSGGGPRPGLQEQSKRLNPGKPRAWLAFRKFRAVCSSCGSSSTTNSLTEWQQLYWQANSIKAPASNKVSGSPLCIKNMESCLHFPECPQP